MPCFNGFNKFASRKWLESRALRRVRLASRRLGFELMEGRMMLSAAPFNLASIDLQLIRSTLESHEYNAGTFTIAPANSGDGGFVSMSSPQSYASTGSINFSNDVTSVGDVDVYISRATNANLSTILDSAGLNLTGTTIKMTGGIQPLVITSDGTGGNLRSTIAPVHQNNVAQTGGQDHGGTISVEALLPAAGAAPITNRLRRRETIMSIIPRSCA